MIGKRLKEARLSKNLTQWQLAELIGVEGTGGNTRIAHYETERYSPSFHVARQLARVLSVPEYYFYIVDDTEAQLLLERYQANQAKGKITLHKLIFEIEDMLHILKKRL
ncbi:helix-turn-helix transcriptional regulator [Escherichia coli]|uniref:helix-turn-helix transcriptional regulator n=1 Tax=Escherichia coli TaxID=562 RepID=UPI000A19CF13|nr:helix-turn-helix transcriptional regulator [Escherichia coli]